MPKIVDQQTREATRKRIIREAAAEFARLGFEQANINTIAEQAGIGKGTIYLYFENKRDLFLAMLRQIAHSHLASIRAALAGDGNLHARLKRLFLAFVQLANEDADSFNVHMSTLYGVNRAFKAEATKLLRDYIAVIALTLEESRIRGEIESTDIEATALMVLTLTESYVLSANALGQSLHEMTQQANRVADMILHGIGVSSP
ncbi:MAG TPA: TetR/AcrR family transcriptional regulator [Ktedonobacteraceae bacterium]|jgi:AcrR family transcriptional regulator|nr:TetR/AcrR family transcriptional regulator [Ktedonobacteraceae bacterium]